MNPRKSNNLFVGRNFLICIRKRPRKIHSSLMRMLRRKSTLTRFKEMRFNKKMSKYIDIDSRFRNRNLYPNPFDFVVRTANPERKSNDEDNVHLQGYYCVKTVFSVVDDKTIQFESKYDDYTGYYLNIEDKLFHIKSLERVSDGYLFRFPKTVSFVSDECVFYSIQPQEIGVYPNVLYSTNTPRSDGVIIKYNDRNIVDIKDEKDLEKGDRYAVFPCQQNIAHHFTESINGFAANVISLDHIIIPYSSDMCSYIYIEFYPISQSSTEVLHSNNIHSIRSLFKIPLEKDKYVYTSDIVVPFKYNLNNDFVFRIVDEWGKPLKSEDIPSPYPPLHTSQVSVLFKIQ